MKLIQQLQQLLEAEKFSDYEEWIVAVKKAYPEKADQLKFKSRVENGKHLFFAEIPGEDRCYGVYSMDDEEGEVLSESKSCSLKLDPQSGECRAKILKACEDRGAKVIDEHDKNGYVVIELPSEGLSTSVLTSYARKLGARFEIVD